MWKVIVFYLSICLIHVIFVLQYEKAASELSSNVPPVVLAKIDASEETNKEFATKYEVQGFPTIKIFRNGGKAVQEYKGPREADGIVSYLKKQSGPASFEIKSPDDATEVVGDKKVVVVSVTPHAHSFFISVYNRQVTFVVRLEFSLNWLPLSLILS